jgi:hypothetical protein
MMKIIMASKTSSCILDSIPTKLLKELLPVLGPPMLNIINGSLSTGCVPNPLNLAVTKPLFKKPNLSFLSFKKISCCAATHCLPEDKQCIQYASV